MRWLCDVLRKHALGKTVAAAAALAAAPFAKADVPLPPPRPAGLGPNLPLAAPLPPVDSRRAALHPSRDAAEPAPAAPVQGPPIPAAAEPAAAEPDPACARVLAAPHAVIRRVEPIKGAEGCALAEPVRLDAVTLADGSRIALEPAPVMRCAMAEAVIDYVRIDLKAAADAIGATLQKVTTAAAYDCRGRNRIAGAKLSEHARGNALDIGGLLLHGGRVITIGDQGMPAPLAQHWRDAACARFTTVLGPGSDPYHQNHIHVDLVERRSHYRMCQWTVPPAGERPGATASPSP